VEFQLHRRDGRLWAAGEMTIYSAASMKEQLLAGDILLPKAACGPCGVGTEKDVTFSGLQTADAADLLLDLSRVSELDTCGVQALLMLRRMVAADGRQLTLINPSAAVCEVIALCGLSALCADAAARAA